MDTTLKTEDDTWQTWPECVHDEGIEGSLAGKTHHPAAMRSRVVIACNGARQGNSSKWGLKPWNSGEPDALLPF